MADLKLNKVLKNTKYDILTPSGFQHFDGLLCGTNKVITLTFSDGNILECTPKHKICINEDDHVFAKDLSVGDKVQSKDNTKITAVDIEKNEEIADVYDFLEVANGHKYYMNNILTKNCLYLDEFAFVKPHIADEFIASVFPTISSGQTTKVIVTSCVAKDTYIFTNKGIEQIQDYINEDMSHGGYEIPEYKVMGMKNELNSGVLMHNEGKVKTLKIDTMYSNLECSHEHKFWACQDGEYKKLRAKEIKVGDYIAVKYGMNCWGDDKIDFIDNTKEYKLSNRLGNIEYLTEDLAYIIGLYLSEGNASNKKIASVVDITCGDNIKKSLDKIGLRYSLAADNLHYRITSKSLVSFLLHLGFNINNRAPKKEIPKRLMKLSKKCTSAMIQGIMDGDGTATKDRYRVAIQLSSKKLIEQIRTLFINYGILSTYTEGITPPTKLVNVSSQYYAIEVSNYDHVKRYFDEIGFRFDRKMCVFESFNEPTRKGHKNDIIPYSVGKLKEFKKQNKISHDIISFVGEHKRNKHWSRDKILNIKSQLESTMDLSGTIFDEVKSDVIWVPIKSIDKSENYVYDFSLNDVEGDKWCHSVVYNGIVGFQTPQGMNHFYKMWQDAKGDYSITEEGNGYVRDEIHWNAVPGRDEKWAREEMARIGEIRFNQEYKCINYNETIKIRSKNTNLVERISIGDFYKRLIKSQNIMNSDVFTNKYEILTPHGFVDFDGIRKTDKAIGITLYLSDGSRFICKDDHEIKTTNGFVKAKNSINCVLLKWNKEVTINKITKNTRCEHFYDVLEIKNNDHSFYSSDIISHNCDFIGSVSTLIDHNYLKELKPTEPMKIPKLPDCVKIWALPEDPRKMEAKNWEYVASIDSGYGIHADYSVLQICLIKSNITIHQVAKLYSNKMDIEEFCKKASNLLKCYRNPRLIIEQNGPGIASMQFFHTKCEYEDIMHFDPSGKHMGLWATDRLKETACILLKTCVQRNFVKLKDRETIEELHSFGKLTQKKWGALGGNHDDHVTSLYWITYYVNTPFFYGNVVEVDMKQVSEDDLLLTTSEEREIESKVMNDVRDPRFHMEELKKGAEFLSEMQNQEVTAENEDDIQGGTFFRA